MNQRFKVIQKRAIQEKEWVSISKHKTKHTALFLRTMAPLDWKKKRWKFPTERLGCCNPTTTTTTTVKKCFTDFV